jgi:1-acyl-sn-glycerol-3-phosphate acyltransferase
MKNAQRSFPFRVLFKWSGMVLVILAFVATGLVLSLLPLTRRLRRKARARTTSFFSVIALAVCGVHVGVHHRERLGRGPHGRLVVANHVSYVDVLVLASLSPMVFITSVEMKHTPLLGLLASWGGSLFVERRRPAGLRKEIDEIARVLREGISVVLFPEGTTSNGERVHPFKRSLFDSAVAAGVSILPLCLRYTAVNGEALVRTNRDSLFYYGGITFFAHVPRFLALRSIDAELFVLKRIAVESGTTRKDLAAMAHDSISKAYVS